MNSRKNASDASASPALAFLHEVSREAKKRGIWKFADELRAMKGTSEELRWPDYVFLPFGGWYTAACKYLGTPFLLSMDADVLRCLAVAGTWRLTQDIIRFDPDLYRALAKTPLEGDISFDFLKRLPAWCVYIETPGLTLNFPDETLPVEGFWALIEYDVNHRTEELRLFFLLGNGQLHASILQISENGSISEAMKRICRCDVADGLIDPDLEEMCETVVCWSSETVTVALNLLLYVCAYWEPAGAGRGVNQRGPKRKKGEKAIHFLPAKRATVVELGARVGDAIRAARKREETAEEPAPDGGRKRRSPRPHIRRGHWHGYWTGPRNPGETQESRKFALKWISPIPVALGEDGDAELYMRRDGTAWRGEMRPDVAIPA